METDGGGLAPAWDPDPTGRHQLRWWDGNGWTDRVCDFGVEASDPVPGVAMLDETLLFDQNGSGPMPADIAALADTIEALVCRLRVISKKDKRIARDRELLELARRSLEQVRQVRGRPRGE